MTDKDTQEGMLKKLMRTYGTQSAVAKDLGVNQGMVSRGLRGNFDPKLRNALYRRYAVGEPVPEAMMVIPCAECGNVPECKCVRDDPRPLGSRTQRGIELSPERARTMDAFVRGVGYQTVGGMLRDMLELYESGETPLGVLMQITDDASEFAGDRYEN